MLSNYHTHTYRCQHATGEDEEYVKRAIDAGIKKLGFSDHAPMPYPEGYISYYKMANDEAEEYMSSVLALGEKYKDKINIHVGFEAEYYPEIFDECLKYWRRLGAEYIILGQHFTMGAEWEQTRRASSLPSDNEALLHYTDTCCEALSTGKFTYFAHPDLLNYIGDDVNTYERCVCEVVRASNDTKTPLEINFLGIKTNRNYPSERFWEIASKYNPSVIFGIDAHSPSDFDFAEIENKALQLARKYNLRIVDDINLKKI